MMPAGTVSIYAGPSDDAALRAFAKSVGLTLLHPHAYRMNSEESERAFDNPIQGGYFSFLPVEELHRHPNPNIGLCEALDPLILYVRPSYKPPYLVAGHVFWDRDVKAFARQTLPYFMKLRRWVQANWKRRIDRYFIGPEAERILEEEHAKTAYLPIGVPIKIVPVD